MLYFADLTIVTILSYNSNDNFKLTMTCTLFCGHYNSGDVQIDPNYFAPL